MELRPGAVNAYSHGWKMMKANFLELLFIVLILAVINGPLGYFNKEKFSFEWSELDSIVNYSIYNAYTMAYWLLIAIPFQFGAALIFLKAARGDAFEIKSIMGAYNRMPDVILTQLLYMVLVFLGFMALIIPGFVVLIRLSFVQYLVMDKGLKPMDAVKTSWRMTSGVGWSILGMAILAIPIFVGGVLFFIVGVLIAIMWLQTSFAAMYYLVDRQQNHQS